VVSNSSPITMMHGPINIRNILILQDYAQSYKIT